MMSRILLRQIVALTLTCGLSATPALAAAAGQAQAAASLTGTASSTSGQTLVNAAVQLRNIASGQLAGTTTSNAVGQFSFIGLNPGTYAVEVVNAAGTVVGTS